MQYKYANYSIYIFISNVRRYFSTNRPPKFLAITKLLSNGLHPTPLTLSGYSPFCRVHLNSNKPVFKYYAPFAVTVSLVYKVN